MPLRRWSGRVRIPLAYLFHGPGGVDGSTMLRKLLRTLTVPGAAVISESRATVRSSKYMASRYGIVLCYFSGAKHPTRATHDPGKSAYLEHAESTPPSVQSRPRR